MGLGNRPTGTFADEIVDPPGENTRRGRFTHKFFSLINYQLNIDNNGFNKVENQIVI